MKAFSFTIALIALSIISYSQGLFDDLNQQKIADGDSKAGIELNGFVRGVVFGGSKDYDYSNAFGEFSLKGKLVKQKAIFYADIRFREGIFFDQRELQLQLKEAYAGYRSKKIDLFMGNQIVVWGRTDGFNPTNNITPNDYFFLTYDPDDQKLSNFMLRTKFKPSSIIDIELIAIPFYKPSVYHYNLFKTEQPAVFNEIETPEISFEKGSIAARFNLEHSFIGLSASYFAGYNPYYGFTLVDYSLNPLRVTYKPLPYFMQTIGVDFALPIRSFIIRGEGALNLTKDYEIEMNIPNPDFAYVIGIEKTFWSTTAIFQYIGKYTIDFTELNKPRLTGFSPEAMGKYAAEMIVYESTLYNRRIFSQQEQSNHMLFLTANRSFFYEQLNVEISGLYNLTTEENMFRSRVKWSLTDAVAANIGCSFMFGPEESLYHMAGKVMNGVFLGLEVGF
jgi:hypothetical protein